MKKISTFLLALISVYSYGQNTIKKDSIKTEVIEVTTSYTPKVTDAEKIRHNPIIQFSGNIDKKKLTYEFDTSPVASTFIPKGAKMKVIDIANKERLFDNYIKGGYGNTFSPYLDFYIHKSLPFKYEYGVKFKGVYNNNPIKQTPLNSSYYDMDVDLMFKNEGEYFDWTTRLDFGLESFNWYGLPEHINFNKKTLDNIKPLQNYTKYGIYGQLDYEDLYIETINGRIGGFTDIFGDNEVKIDANSLFIFPLHKYQEDLNDLMVEASVNILSGQFTKGYKDYIPRKHQIGTLSFNPYYNHKFGNIQLRGGLKTKLMVDVANSKTKVLAYPDIHANFGLNETNTVSYYLGLKGDLEFNSFEKFADTNPYISPTLNIFPTDQKYNLYTGFKGMSSTIFNYNVKAHFIGERNKPMFIKHDSRSNGASNLNRRVNKPYEGYEYGNSFDVVYDDVRTLIITGEVEYELSENLNIGLNGTLNKYFLKNQKKNWNLPEIKSELILKYGRKKWFSSLTLDFIGKRYDVSYEKEDFTKLDPYINLNFNGGYHLNDYLTLFVKGTNLTNNNYQHFKEFNVQGIQAVGGIIFKFDKVFLHKIKE